MMMTCHPECNPIEGTLLCNPIEVYNYAELYSTLILTVPLILFVTPYRQTIGIVRSDIVEKCVTTPYKGL